MQCTSKRTLKYTRCQKTYLVIIWQAKPDLQWCITVGSNHTLITNRLYPLEEKQIKVLQFLWILNIGIFCLQSCTWTSRDEGVLCQPNYILCRREDNPYKVTAVLNMQVILPKSSYNQVTDFCICSHLPYLHSANSKRTFWQPYHLVSFGALVPQWELEEWFINKTQPLITPSTSPQVQLSTTEKTWQFLSIIIS